MGSERRLATWGWKRLRGAGDDLFLMTQPASPETLENHALFGKIGLSLKKVVRSTALRGDVTRREWKD